MNYLLLLLLFPLTVLAQDAAVPLVMYAEGQIRYEAAGGASDVDEVHAGHYLTGGGALVLSPSARLELLANEQFVRLTEAGRYSIPQLFGTPPAKRGFLSRFYQFVRQGWEDGASTEDLERAYQANQGNAQGNISGLGDAGLTGLLPFGGWVGPDSIRFSWPAEGSATAYRLRIVDSLSEAVVLEATTADSSLRLQLGDLQLTDGNAYYWEVFPNLPARSGPTRLGAAAPTVAGTRIYFGYRHIPAETVLRSVGQADTIRQTQRGTQRYLMTAMILEEANYLYRADETYRTALRQLPGDPLLTRTYAAFLSRWNQRPAARALLQSLH